MCPRGAADAHWRYRAFTRSRLRFGVGGLTEELHSELHITRRAGGSDAAEERAGDIRGRSRVVHAVERVEGLPAELQLFLFRHAELLGERGVELQESRPFENAEWRATPGI